MSVPINTSHGEIDGKVRIPPPLFLPTTLCTLARTCFRAAGVSDFESELLHAKKNLYLSGLTDQTYPRRAGAKS